MKVWNERTGELPQELIFDSKLTTYANLNQLNQQGIAFITLRRRSKKLLEQIRQQPLSAWRRSMADRNALSLVSSWKVVSRLMDFASQGGMTSLSPMPLA